MKASDLRAFARRPWAEVEQSKAEYWLHARRRGGAARMLAIGDLLREHVTAHTDLMSAAARKRDLAHHVELKRKLDEASKHFVADVLRDLARAFREVRATWYLFGAQALVLRGLPRATADVDVTVLGADSSRGALVAAFERAGISVRSQSKGFVSRTRVLPLLHLAAGMPVDVVLGGPGLEELFASRCEKIRVGNVGIPVASATDLVIMKTLAGRPKDLEDAVALVRSGSVDPAEVSRVVAELASALAEDDIVERWAAIGKRARTKGRRG